MNVLLLDINNQSLIRALQKNIYLKIVIGTIRGPILFPIPDLIIIDFDQVFGSDKRESVLIEIADKLHPQVTIMVYSEEWNDSTIKFARWFGADKCYDSDKLNMLVDEINRKAIYGNKCR